MAIPLKNLIELLETAAPPDLAEPWDNPGLAVGDPAQLIEKVLVGMDVTLPLIAEARALGAQLILTHHPLLFARPDAVTPASVQGRKLRELIRNDLAAYSAHTNLDKVAGGMNDDLMDLLGFSPWEILDGDVSTGGGIGRRAVVAPVTLEVLARRIGETLQAKALRFVGEPGRLITSVAVINGSGAEYISLAKDLGIDCVITGDTKYHEVLDALEEGICVIDPGHFASEWLIFSRVIARIEAQARAISPIEFVWSQSAADPFQTLTP